MTRTLLLATLALLLPAAGCGSPAASVAPRSPGLPAVAATAAVPAASSPETEPAPPPEPAVPVEPPLLPAFVYHHVKPGPDNFIAISPETFERHLRILADEGFEGITVSELAAHLERGEPLPDKPVLLTFDDAWANQYRWAAPLLEKHGFDATFFVYPSAAGGGAFMSKSQVRDLAKRGFDIQPHTWRHGSLLGEGGESAEETGRRLAKDLRRADEWIRDVTGEDPVALAYPYGYYDASTEDVVRSAGYLLGLTVDDGSNDLSALQPYAVKRFTVFKADSIDDFRDRLLSRPLRLAELRPASGERVAGPVELTAILEAGEDDIEDARYLVDTEEVRTRRSGERGIVARLEGKRGFHYITLTGEAEDGRAVYASWGVVLE